MQNCKNFCLVSLSLVLFGLAGTSFAGADPTLKEIRVSGPGSHTQHVEIVADSPLTYTYYKMPDLLKVVIDLALVNPGQVPPVVAGSGLISRINVEKKDVSTFSLTRVLIDLATDAEFSVHSDAGDRSRLLVTLKRKEDAPATGSKGDLSGEAMEGSPSDNTAPEKIPAEAAPATTPPPPLPANLSPAVPLLPAALPAPAPTQEKTAPLTTPRPAPKPALMPVVPSPNPARAISGIRVTGNLVEITANTRLDDYRAFTLTDPARLVIDIPMTKTALAAKEIPLKRFGLSKARVGNYPDKVRMVFDADDTNFPPYRINRNANGLAIIFPGKTGK